MKILEHPQRPLDSLVLGANFDGVICKRVAPGTDSGWASYGKGGRLFLPAITNAVTNPRFETGTTSWAANGTGASISRVPSATPFGNYFLRLTQTGANTAQARFTSVSVTASDIWTVSAWVKSTTSAYIKLALTNYASSVIATSYTLVGSDWARVSVTGSLSATASHTLHIEVDGANGNSDESVDIVAVSATKSNYLTPYFDGGSAGCSWSGTAHASTSLTTASDLRLPTGYLTNSAGTIAARFTPLEASATATNQWLVSQFGAAEVMSVGVTGNVATIRSNAGGGWTKNSATLGWAAGSTNHIVGRWTSGANQDLNTNGTNATQGTNTTAVNAASGTLTIGDLTGSDRRAKGYVGPVILSKSRKADAWVTAITNNSGAAFRDMRRLWMDFMSNGDILIPLERDGFAYQKTF